MRSGLLLALLGLLSTACTPRAGLPADPVSSTPTPTRAAATAPQGGSVGPEGFATILGAPPAPFQPVEPGPPAPPTPEQVVGNEQFARVGAFQREVRPEAQALDRRLKVAERGNYVSRYFNNEGTPTAVFQFLRDGPETLRKYTRHPRFVGETVRFSQAEVERAADFMMRTFREDRVLGGVGTGNKQNRASVQITVPEAEFRALVARKGVTIPEAVDVEFAAEQPASKLNAPLPPEIARWVRVFPRDDRPVGVVNAINSYAKVVLRDGCFRAPDQSDALVLLPLGARLIVDSEGYLAFGGTGSARVGETVLFPGSIEEVTAPELVGPIRAVCGAGKVIRITATASEAADRAQFAVTENTRMLRDLQESYGLTPETARKVLERCKVRSGSGVCPHVPPPPPTLGQACPPKTKQSFGLCRTREGYIRPIPNWIEELAKP